MAVTLRQSDVDNDAAGPVAIWGVATLADSLIVCAATERSGLGHAGMSISGSGWTKELGVDNELANGDYRCSLAVWWKVGVASEPNVQVTGGTIRTALYEFAGDAGETYTLQAEAQNATGAADDATMDTGTTASTSGDQLVLTFVGGRAGNPGPASALWTTATEICEAGFGSNFSRLLHIGMLTTSATGTKTDTSTTLSPRSYNGAAAGILVFSLDGGAPAVVIPSLVMAPPIPA